MMSSATQRWSFGEFLHGLETGRLRVPIDDSTQRHLTSRSFMLLDGTALHVDVAAVLNALMDEQTVPRVVLWHRPRDERGTWWVVRDPDELTVVALAFMIITRRASQLRWFLDVSSWRFETDMSDGEAIRDSWLPIQALCYSGLRERWVATRFGGFPDSTIDRIGLVTEELFGRPVEVDTATDGKLSRLAAKVYPPPPQEDRLRGSRSWQLEPTMRSWSATANLLVRLLGEPGTAPWPNQEEPDPLPPAPTPEELDAHLLKIWKQPSPMPDPAIMATARPGYRPVESFELFGCALAAGGRIDIDTLQSDFGDVRRVSALYERTAALIAEAVDFLREDCEMPHWDLAMIGGHKLLFPALVRYVALHGRPTGIAAARLCQWYWRWAATGGLPSSLPDLLGDIDDDPDGSTERLLAQAPATPSNRWEADAVPGTIFGPEYLLALLHAEPRDLKTGTDLTTTVTRAHERLPLRNVLPKPYQGVLQGQIIQKGPAKEPVIAELLTAPEEIIASHLLDAEAIALLRSGEHRDFLAHRAALITRQARGLVFRLTGWSP